jgi:demethylmenaquinone methyltransferase/2-methoxy-6-polyprenyl-1,4-benzoquinol methylase
MQAYYAVRAPYYDDVYLKPERRADLEFLSAHLPSRVEGRSTLEIACGTGFWTQFLATKAGTLVATDATLEPLEFARRRPNADRVSFIQADAYALGSELGTFEAAFAGLWFSHVPKEGRHAFLRSLHSRLLPGARVIFLDNSTVQCLEHPIVETDAHGNTYQRRKLKDGSMHRVLKNFPTEVEWRALVEPVSASCAFRELENFWLAEYELAAP